MCTWWFGTSLNLYAVLPSLLAQAWSWESSLVHQCLDFSVISTAGTTACMASCKAFVSSLHLASSCAWSSIHAGARVLLSCFLSSVLKSSQFMFQKFRMGLASIVITAKSSSIRTGRWSLLVPLSPSNVLQEISDLFE